VNIRTTPAKNYKNRFKFVKDRAYVENTVDSFSGHGE